MSVRINLYKKKGWWDVLGWALSVEQADTDITHVNIEIDGVCWTTGARWHPLRGPVFGAVPAAKYNRNREYIACEFVEPLSVAEQSALLAACQACEGQRYGYEKVLGLILKKRQGGFIDRLGDIDVTIKNPYCAEHVVDACWKIGRLVCRWLGKREPGATKPADLATEAKRGVIIRPLDPTRNDF